MILERKHVLRCIALIGVSSLLAACSSVQKTNDAAIDARDASDSSLKGKTAIHHWQVQGTNLFVCSRDKKGYYWRYINTQGRVTNDKGQAVAELTTGNRIVTLSGTQISLRSPRLIERRGSADLPDVLFEAQTFSNEPAYKGVLYISRRQAKGGLPLDGCSAGQYRQTLKVNYSARFVLWR